MERIKEKIERLKELIHILDELKAVCMEKIAVDKIYRGALLHYLYLTADTCIVLAEMVIKKYRFSKPATYSGSFDVLGENSVLDPEFAYIFSRIAGLRNFLAHDYERIDNLIICRDTLNKIGEIRRFIESIERYIESH